MSKFLKVKIKSLAEEQRIIKREEQRYRGPKWGANWTRVALMVHRLNTVRPEIRASHLAYGYLRGKPLHCIESQSTRSQPDWTRVFSMVKKYGTFQQVQDFEQWKQPQAKAA